MNGIKLQIVRQKEMTKTYNWIAILRVWCPPEVYKKGKRLYLSFLKKSEKEKIVDALNQVERKYCEIWHGGEIEPFWDGTLKAIGTYEAARRNRNSLQREILDAIRFELGLFDKEKEKNEK